MGQIEPLTCATIPSASAHASWRRDAFGRAWNPGTAGTLILAIITTGIPVLLHLAAQPAALAACVMLAVLVATCATPAIPIVLLFSYLFQNLFVALISPGIETMEQFNASRGYNFVFTATVWAVLAASYFTARASFDRKLRSLIDVTTVTLFLAAGYFILGVLTYPANVVYLRNIITPILLFHVFAIVAYRHRIALTAPLVIIAVATLVYGYLELFAQDTLFSLVNGDTYLDWRTKDAFDSGAWLKELQTTGRVIRSYLDTMVIDFLNTPFLADYGLRFNRIVGPNFHFISYAYALAFFSVVLAGVGRWWYAAAAIPLLLIIGSKGALLFAVLLMVAIPVLLRQRGFVALWIFAAALLLYIGVAIVAGMRAQDYHVIGLMGGFKGFIANPLGRGIGVGGNLSLDMSTIDWSKSQHLGHTDIAVESAIGVLLYQMGIFAIGFIAVILWIAVEVWRCYVRSGQRLHGVVSLSILTITANGFFQEEALFAPLALAVVVGLAGLLIGRECRDAASDVRGMADVQRRRSPGLRRAVPAGAS